jgi:hypothetical protein
LECAEDITPLARDSGSQAKVRFCSHVRF